VSGEGDSRIDHAGDSDQLAYDKVVRLAPKSLAACHRRARLRAACSDAKYRDGEAAVEDATRDAVLTRWTAPVCIETLAAAYVERGDFA
jgi:hypothetical protein